MNLSRFGIALCLILGIAGLVQAQPACDWTTDTVSGINRIWQNCGRVGIGTQPSYPLHLVDTGTSADTSIAAFRSLSTNYTQTNRIDQGLWFAAYFNATTHNGSMIGQRVDSFNL